MALIDCPECGKQVSDAAKSCPGCGYPISSNDRQIREKKPQSIKSYMPMICVTIAVVFVIIVGKLIADLGTKKDDYSSRRKSYSYDYSGGYSDYSNYSNFSSDSGKDASSIFNNLSISDFSCSSGKYSGTMSCKVKNNNSFTVRGYFRVNFYDNTGALIYNQLMSLPDVASGETVVCSTSIPKDDYPHNYESVDFSQASLIESN